jgi:hypothetical protein
MGLALFTGCRSREWLPMPFIWDTLTPLVDKLP